jgi:hypothetical protein
MPRHLSLCCNLPILADPLYNPSQNPLLQVYPDSSPNVATEKSSQQMQFFATSLSFPAFSSSEILSYTICPDKI